MSHQEYSELIQYLDKRFISIDDRFDAIDNRFAAMDLRFDAMDDRFDAMDAKFEKLEDRVGHLEVFMDGFMKQLVAIQQELTILVHRADRIEAWIKSAALKLGVPYIV